MIPADTSGDAWDLQIKIYRRMTPLQRLEVALNLTDLSRFLLERGVRQRAPAGTETDIRNEVKRLWLRPLP